jgi:hypothetical protein
MVLHLGHNNFPSKSSHHLTPYSVATDLASAVTTHAYLTLLVTSAYETERQPCEDAIEWNSVNVRKKPRDVLYNEVRK